MFVRCLKCDKVMDSGIKCASKKEEREMAWDMPGGGVVFYGGCNYGSSIIDALVDGVEVKIVICDICISKALDTGKALKIRRHTKTEEVIDE